MGTFYILHPGHHLCLYGQSNIWHLHFDRFLPCFLTFYMQNAPILAPFVAKIYILHGEMLTFTSWWASWHLTFPSLVKSCMWCCTFCGRQKPTFLTWRWENHHCCTPCEETIWIEIEIKWDGAYTVSFQWRTVGLPLLNAPFRATVLRLILCRSYWRTDIRFSLLPRQP